MELIVLLVIILLLSFIVSVIIFIIIPLTMMFGASFERSDKKSIKTMLKFANVKKGEKVAELGSGDGTLVIEFAKQGAEVIGYEINPLLVLWSKFKIKRLGLKNAKIFWKNFWNIELGNFDVISVFQINYVMPALYEKLKKEARKKIRVISNNWEFPNLRYLKKEKRIFLYEIEHQ